MSVGDIRELWINRFSEMHSVKLNVSEYTIYQVFKPGELLTVDDISDRTGIEAHWVRPCLRSLRDKGYVHTDDCGKNKRWYIT